MASNCRAHRFGRDSICPMRRRFAKFGTSPVTPRMTKSLTSSMPMSGAPCETTWSNAWAKWLVNMWPVTGGNIGQRPLTLAGFHRFENVACLCNHQVVQTVMINEWIGRIYPVKHQFELGQVPGFGLQNWYSGVELGVWFLGIPSDEASQGAS